MAYFTINVYNGNNHIDTINLVGRKVKIDDDKYNYYKISKTNQYGIQYVAQNKETSSYCDVCIKNVKLSPFIKFKIK